MATATVTPKVTREHVCTFDKLSDRAKENARDWMRELEGQDFDTHFMFESFRDAAKLLGIEFDTTKHGELDIRWSGFSSQGDGASFVGSYSHMPNSPAKVREEFPSETDLHVIADGLDALQFGYKLLTGHRINAKIQDDNHYVHKYTMDCTVEDSETQEELDWDSETAKRTLELMRDFADWIYDSLEEEYEYRLSDEAIEDTIRANEYKFQTATGKVV